MGPPEKDKKIDLTVPDPIVGEQGPVYEDLLTVQALINAIDITNPIQTLKNFAGLLVDEVKNIAEAVKDLDEESSRLVRSLGVSKDRAGELSSTVARAIPRFVDMGMGIDAAGDTYNELIKNLDTNMMVSDKTLADFAATSKVTGVAQKDLAVKFRDVGVGLSSVGDKMLDVVKVARQAGATVGAVSDGVVSNLDKMNLYNFDGGIKGLAKMAAQASRLGIEMSGIFSIVTKVFDPEGAIEFAASLQRLGVTSSQLLDPLRLMDLAQNDPTELQNQIVNMTKEFTRFNKENNQIEILPGAKRRLDEIGRSMGYNNGELQKMAVNAGMFDMKLKQIKFPSSIANKEDRELIATMAQINKDGIATVQLETKKIENGVEVGSGIYESKAVSDLTEQDVKNLAEQQKGEALSMETIARNQLDELKKINGTIGKYQAALRYGSANAISEMTGYQKIGQVFETSVEGMLGKENSDYLSQTSSYQYNFQGIMDTLGNLVGGIDLSPLGDFTDYVKNLSGTMMSKFGFGGEDTQFAPSNYNGKINGLSTDIATQKIETENNIKVDFKVTTDENILPKTKEDINSAIDYYFNGPRGQENIQKLITQMYEAATSNGLIKKP